MLSVSPREVGSYVVIAMDEVIKTVISVGDRVAVTSDEPGC
jgi:hypothetical protein